MLDSLDAWANGETVAAPVYTPAPSKPARRSVRRSNVQATIAANLAASKAAPRGPISLAAMANAMNAAATPAPLGFVAPNGATGDEALDALKAAHPAEAAWLLDGTARGNGFAFSLLRRVRRLGDLTARQLESVTEAIAKDAAKVAPVVPAPAPVILPPVSRVGGIGSVPLVAPVAPAAPAYVPPVVAVPVNDIDGFKLSADPLSDNWPVLFSTAEGHSVADTGGNVLCIASQGLPVKFARLGATVAAPVTVAITEAVWLDFRTLSRVDFIANHLSR